MRVGILQHKSEKKKSSNNKEFYSLKIDGEWFSCWENSLFSNIESADLNSNVEYAFESSADGKFKNLSAFAMTNKSADKPKLTNPEDTLQDNIILMSKVLQLTKDMYGVSDVKELTDEMTRVAITLFLSSTRGAK